MKVLGICGSPRRDGNTAFLLKQALLEAEKLGLDTQLCNLSELRFSDCIGCEGCRDTFHCVLKDDMQKLYPLIEEADALILGSPTYFYDVTGLMKTFLDRLYCYEGFDALDRSVWMSLFEATSSKLAAVISVCEQTRPEDTGYAAKTMALTLQSLGYRITDSTEILRLYQKDQARGDEHAVNRARSTGEKLARTVLLKKKILEEGKSAEK